jgi:hypothetical protein
MIAGHYEFLDQLTNGAVRFELIIAIRQAGRCSERRAAAKSRYPFCFPKQPSHLIQLPQRRYGRHGFA